MVSWMLGILLTIGASAETAEARAVGVYADSARSQTCVSGRAGDRFLQHVFARAPGGRGLVYVTLRFDFPENLSRRARPVFHPAVTELIVTDYADGTVEWNLLFDDSCSTGWVEVFRQEVVLLDAEPSVIGIEARHSLIRDCDFVLSPVVVENELGINTAGCEAVSVSRTSWSSAKAVYR